jgi:hypothetical protein
MLLQQMVERVEELKLLEQLQLVHLEFKLATY